MFPWHDGEKYCNFLRATVTSGDWGRHLAIASSVYRVRVQVAGDWPYMFASEEA